jgi:hypothetical protein
MIHLVDHTGDLGSQLHLYRTIDLAKAQSLDRSDLGLRTLDRTSDLCDLYFRHDSYPLNTLDNEMPRLRATVYASRMLVKALNVAFTTL